MIDHLSEWGAGPPLEFDLMCPTPDAEGSVTASASFDWNLPRESRTGMGLVVYVFDGNREWRIASGADPETGALRARRSFDAQNSRDLFPDDPGQFEVTTQDVLPKLGLDPPDPSTRIIDSVAVPFFLGPESLFADGIVPTDPTELPGFTPPDLDQPSCPCPEPENPACQ